MILSKIQKALCRVSVWTSDIVYNIKGFNLLFPHLPPLIIRSIQQSNVLFLFAEVVTLLPLYAFLPLIRQIHRSMQPSTNCSRLRHRMFPLLLLLLLCSVIAAAKRFPWSLFDSLFSSKNFFSFRLSYFLSVYFKYRHGNVSFGSLLGGWFDFYY